MKMPPRSQKVSFNYLDQAEALLWLDLSKANFADLSASQNLYLVIGKTCAKEDLLLVSKMLAYPDLQQRKSRLQQKCQNFDGYSTNAFMLLLMPSAAPSGKALHRSGIPCVRMTARPE